MLKESASVYVVALQKVLFFFWFTLAWGAQLWPGVWVSFWCLEW